MPRGVRGVCLQPSCRCGVWLALLLAMLLRRTSQPFLVSARKLLWPALALGLIALAATRRSRATAPLPRLPVRRRPKAPPSSSRLRRLSAPPVEVEPPDTFWDARVEDDPAEIPDRSSPLVSEASQLAAGVGAGAYYDASLPLRW
jgi:hypothetical protein